MENTNPPEDNKGAEKQLAAISYLSFFSVFILLAKRDNEFIQHHARRGFTLFLFSVVLWIFPFLRYGEFVILVFVVLGFISAAQGNENTMPILSELADGTLSLRHIKLYWHSLKHGVIKIFKPDHITPAYRTQLTAQYKESDKEEKFIEKEKEATGLEEKKLSALYHRVGEDEKRIDELADEVHNMEKEMDELKK